MHKFCSPNRIVIVIFCYISSVGPKYAFKQSKISQCLLEIVSTTFLVQLINSRLLSFIKIPLQLGWEEMEKTRRREICLCHGKSDF
jgi:hypothetical protein